MKISNSIVQVGEEHSDVLRKGCQPVSIRLMRDNPAYFKLISCIVDYMLDILHTKYEDYPELKGMSGANICIPFNIVAIKEKHGNLVMINPCIVRASKQMKRSKSNCGSINLKVPIVVERPETVIVEYYSYYDFPEYPIITKEFTSGTVQHEIEHNQGILITDKEVK